MKLLLEMNTAFLTFNAAYIKDAKDSKLRLEGGGGVKSFRFLNILQLLLG